MTVKPWNKRAVEGVAKEASMKVKAALCELLSEVHAELGASQFGRHVNHKLRVTDFVKNKQVLRRHGEKRFKLWSF